MAGDARTGSASRPTQYNRPIPREGPDVPYNNDAGSNPVLRGWTLAVVSSVIASSAFIQSIFWRLNGFDRLKDIPELRDYEPRHDPTVIPISRSRGGEEVLSVKDLPHPRPRKDGMGYWTCADFHQAYLSGKITPTDVVELLLPLIKRDAKTPGQHSVAFLQVREDLVLQAARESTERYKAGAPLSVLDGVPVAIKDEVDVTGYRKTQGAKLDFTDPKDSTTWCVKKWQAAGATVIGKTNMHEVGLDTTNNNVNYGTPRNPHNPGYYTGGSSGGSAYAVASGLCPIALGKDGGGSIRLPASFCGVYGLKTTHGRVSDRAGHEKWNSVGVCGPLASSIDDLALAYRVMAQPDPESRTSSDFPNSLVGSSSELSSRAGPKYLGICEYWINRADPPVKELFSKAVEYLVKTQGYEVVNIKIPFLPQGQKAHALSILSESRSEFSKEQISKLTYHNQLLLNVAGSHATAQDFLYCQRLRTMLMGHLAWLWEKYPGMLVLTPTTPNAGWKIAQPGDLKGHGVSDGDMSLKSMEFVYVANFTGNPALGTPMGYVEDVPVGLMAMADWGCEEQLLDFGRECDGLLGEEGVRRPKPESAYVDLLATIKGA